MKQQVAIAAILSLWFLSCLLSACETDDVEEPAIDPCSEIRLVGSQINPITSCFEMDGELAVAVLNGADTIENANIEWFLGEDLIGTGYGIESDQPGIYQIEVQVNDTDCSLSTSVILTDLTRFEVLLWESHQQTDPDNPNGELMAGVRHADDTVTEGYSFTWFYGTSQTPSDSLAQGPVASNLAGGSYLVSVINEETDCNEVSTATVTTNFE